MHPDEQVRAYLWDIRDAAREIAGFVRGVSFDQFEKNKVLRYAIERQLRLIGDVADHMAISVLPDSSAYISSRYFMSLVSY